MSSAAGPPSISDSMSRISGAESAAVKSTIDFSSAVSAPICRAPLRVSKVTSFIGSALQLILESGKRARGAAPQSWA
jgi:hypothetical protein